MSDSSSTLRQMKCQILATGCAAQILIHEDVADDFFALDSRQKARILSIMELWCEGMKVNSEKFNENEGRTKGNHDKMLKAFKIKRVRFYGYVRSILGKKTFIFIDCDPDKKTDKAKPRILNRAKDRVNNFEEAFGGSYD